DLQVAVQLRERGADAVAARHRRQSEERRVDGDAAEPAGGEDRLDEPRKLHAVGVVTDDEAPRRRRDARFEDAVLARQALNDLAGELGRAAKLRGFDAQSTLAMVDDANSIVGHAQ